MVNESFYIAICFVALVIILYKKGTIAIGKYLSSNINEIAAQIEEAKQINAQAKKLFTQANKNFDFFILEKEEKLAKAKIHASEVCNEYIQNTDALLQARRGDFGKQIEQLQNDFIDKARNKIAGLTYEVVNEVIKHDKFNISNKIN